MICGQGATYRLDLPISMQLRMEEHRSALVEVDAAPRVVREDVTRMVVGGGEGDPGDACTKAGNKGADAALSAIEMATLLRQLDH